MALFEKNKGDSAVIKAIETAYKGFRFRSRLEARWAVFFDAMGIEWKYEIEGFKIWKGGCEASEDGANLSPPDWFYLPDFYLPVEQCWVEVKGDQGSIDCEMFTHAVDFGGQLPHLKDSAGTTRGILFLSDIPEPPRAGKNYHWESELIAHPILQHCRGVQPSAIAFGIPGWAGNRPDLGTICARTFLAYVDHDFPGWESGNIHHQDVKLGEFSTREMIAAWQWKNKMPVPGHVLFEAFQRQQRAYQLARSARFEHGEKPAAS